MFFQQEVLARVEWKHTSDGTLDGEKKEHHDSETSRLKIAEVQEASRVPIIPDYYGLVIISPDNSQVFTDGSFS